MPDSWISCCYLAGYSYYWGVTVVGGSATVLAHWNHTVCIASTNLYKTGGSFSFMLLIKQVIKQASYIYKKL